VRRNPVGLFTADLLATRNNIEEDGDKGPFSFQQKNEGKKAGVSEPRVREVE